MCPHAECAGKAKTSYARKGNLLRHYYQHLEINEKYVICEHSFICLATLVSHYEYCKKKNGASQDMKDSQATEPMKRLCRLASKKLDDQLKKAVDAGDVPTDEESIHSEEARTLQKRRRMGGNAPADLDPTARYHQSGQVYGDNISGGASTTVAPFNSNLSSRLDPTRATPAGAEPIPSRTIDSCLSHAPVPRSPFLFTYNVDDGCDQVPRAPRLSTYTMDDSSNHPQIHSQQSMRTALFPSHQSSVDLSGYGNDQVESQHVSQHKALSSSSQETATLYARAPQLSFSAMNQYPNINQVTSQTSAKMYENSQLMPYHTGPVQGVPNSGHSY
ncbi:hypothetical protein N7G274_010092 [Stereocaulon virgatum]|uniref:C2H2-type domain-containing protein n=1 Tax=Stereocaulon virgatum TaxID=373712 RepID=A0ABR3ZUG7_9LECA